MSCRDVIRWLKDLPDDYADLMFCSPPYEAKRTYGIDFKLKGQAWVDWMFQVVTAAQPKVKGLIAIVCEGTTNNFKYSAVPFLLAADLHRAGFNLRKPPAFQRVGISGSGGSDWLRNDYEPIICVTRPGKLPWSNNTAMGHAPKWAPGGEMSHRLSDGSRRNQWGKNKASKNRDRHGKMQGGERPSHQVKTIREGKKAGYKPPKLANPGNVIKCKVGGGLMGHPLAHDNEAAFPLTLAEFFVLSFCPLGGMVIDPFSGSGTTGHAAIENGRLYHGCDIRKSQATLTNRRLASVTPKLFQ